MLWKLRNLSYAIRCCGDVFPPNRLAQASIQVGMVSADRDAGGAVAALIGWRAGFTDASYCVVVLVDATRITPSDSGRMAEIEGNYSSD